MHINRKRPAIAGSLCTLFLLGLLAACSIPATGGPTTPQASATTSGTGGASGATAQENQIAQTVFQAVNKSRAENGLPALKWNTALVRSARQHNLAMQAANTLSHQLPGEAGLGDRESQQGIHWVFAAENIGETSEMTTNGALALHQAMMNEKPPDDGHRQNILTKVGTIIGIDILLDQQHGTLWLTEDFAKE
ncbi:MAG TPA: CAP domain-containing protein [Ktedonobacteraceae bacterium]|nr:CAP domain-containing protein [Ktedonobacteraceae bacterium]